MGIILNQGYFGTPPIITSGLTLYLDAANSKSYVTGSTVWNDLGGLRNSGSFVNGPGFSTDGGGSITLSTGAVSSISNFPIQLSGTGSKTVSCFFKSSGITRSGLLSTRNTTGTAGWTLNINNPVGSLGYFIVGTGGGILTVAAGIVTGSWFNATATYNLATTTTILYLNGIQIGSNTSFANNTNISALSGSIGIEGTSFNLSGNIATTLIYNRALSAAEVLQNYNALKSRFGLS